MHSLVCDRRLSLSSHNLACLHLAMTTTDFSVGASLLFTTCVFRLRARPRRPSLNMSTQRRMSRSPSSNAFSGAGPGGGGVAGMGTATASAAAVFGTPENCPMDNRA